MKRAGFTMIELIFVIVILGILAAVAVPKMGAVSEQAKVQNVESFMATLNRTVAPTMWATVVSNGGDITGLTITDYIDLPTGITINLANCDLNGTTDAGDVTTAALPVAEDIYCRNGTSTTQPKFGFTATDLNQSVQNN